MQQESQRQENPHVKRAVEILGSQAKLGKACEVKQQIVYGWLHMANVPVDKAMLIEVATDGEVKKEDLNPEFFSKIPKVTIEKRKHTKCKECGSDLLDGKHK